VNDLGGSDLPQSGKGTRLPRNHALVLDTVRAQGAGVHATTHDIFAAAKQRQPAIGYSTVYRALARLRDLGLVSEVALPGARAVVYEPAAPTHGHFHCRRCGQVEDIGYDLPADFVQRVEAERGVAITEALLTLNGVCAACQAGGG
jgi:Fur family transcriptional regulator, ferric uptake regulator